MQRLLFTAFMSLACGAMARAQNADDMAKQVVNPIASLTSQILKIGNQLVSLQAGGAWYVEAPPGRPNGVRASP